MPQYRDIAVSVSLRSTDGNQLLEEYEVTIDETKRTVTCWICSEERKEFVISAFNQSRTQAIRCCTLVDGRSVDHALWRPQEFGCIEGAYVSENSLVPFAFSRIQLTDEDNILNSYGPPNLEALGTIRFVVLRCTIEVEGLSYSHQEDEFDLRDIGPIHERTKKAGGHCVSLGDETQTVPALSAYTRDVDSEENPYCIFIFRYRPWDLLKAQGTIPYSPQTLNDDHIIKTEPMKAGSLGGNPKGKKRALELSSPAVKREVKDEYFDVSDQGARRNSLEVQETLISSQLQAVRAQMIRLQEQAGSSGRSHVKRVKRESVSSDGDLITKGKGRPVVIDLTLD